MRLIDADALIQEIKENNEGYYFNSSAEREANFAKVNYAIDRIGEAPTVEYTFEEAFQKTICEQKLYCPKRPVGHWVNSYKSFNCSVCGKIAYSWNHFGEYIQVKSNFCPNCGAKMTKEAENEKK